MPKIETPWRYSFFVDVTFENLENYLNTLSYSLSWSETNNNSNLLQNDYEKETFNFGLTKRVYF